MSYTPSNISNTSFETYDSSSMSTSSIWQEARTVFDARTGFFVEHIVNPSGFLLIRPKHFAADSIFTNIPVRALSTFSSSIKEDSAVAIEISTLYNLLDTLFQGLTNFNLKYTLYRAISLLFDNSASFTVGILLKALFALNAFNAEASTKFGYGLRIPEGILSIPNENASKFALTINRIARVFLDTSISTLDLHLDTRSITPVNAALLPKLVVKSDFSINQLVPNRPVVYLSDDYLQPVDYEHINNNRVSAIFFSKAVSTFFKVRSFVHWIDTIASRKLDPVDISAKSNFYIDKLKGIKYLLVHPIIGKLNFIINCTPLRRVSFVITAISSYIITHNIPIRGIYPEIFTEDSLVEFIKSLPIKRSLSVIFDLISLFEIIISFWREGRPAIRVTTLHHDMLRKPRGAIVILEDPTL